MRTGKITRTTRETDIEVSVDLDGGAADISTGIGFFDHMLTALSVHSGIGMTVRCKGDLEVDGHHTVEDVGICIGMALREALGDRKGIARYGSFFIPMDEALAFASLDISGRPFLVYNAQLSQERCGEFDTCLGLEFFRALAVNAGITLHIRLEYGVNAHHELEAIFKAVAHALKAACRIEYEDTLSTKGVL
ncbi:MAG: imidazoleglycerol-phosphate dehydratase HisB [Ruminococcaceae bacterium]|nr:imidazoleglycerol-phosphate dehydratase HisB [Oscillospiraceae bacterium]